MPARTHNRVARTPSGKFAVKFRAEGRGTSRTFESHDDAEAFAIDGAAFGWPRAIELADSRANAATPHLANQPTLGALAQTIAMAKTRPNTRDNYRGRAAWIDLHPIAGLPVGAITTAHVEGFMEWLAHQDKRSGVGRLSSRTVHGVYVYLVQVFRHARDKGWAKISPMDGIKAPMITDAKPRHALSTYEVSAIFAQAPDDNAAAYFRFMLATGARPSEAEGVTWDGVIPVEGGRADVHIPGTKTKNADRWVTVSMDVLPVIAVDAWAPYLFNPRTRYDEVFRTMVNRAQMVGTARAAGFEPLTYFEKVEVLEDPRRIMRPTPHTLRHTHATRMFHSGLVAESAIIGRLGHQSANYSRENYVDMAEVEARRAAGDVATELFPEALRQSDADAPDMV